MARANYTWLCLFYDIAIVKKLLNSLPVAKSGDHGIQWSLPKIVRLFTNDTELCLMHNATFGKLERELVRTNLISKDNYYITLSLFALVL